MTHHREVYAIGGPDATDGRHPSGPHRYHPRFACVHHRNGVDHTTSTGPPTHAYTQVGNCTVTLGATNLNATATITSATPVRVLRPGLVIAYGFEEASGPDVTDLSGKGVLGDFRRHSGDK